MSSSASSRDSAKTKLPVALRLLQAPVAIQEWQKLKFKGAKGSQSKQAGNNMAAYKSDMEILFGKDWQSISRKTLQQQLPGASVRVIDVASTLTADESDALKKWLKSPRLKQVLPSPVSLNQWTSFVKLERSTGTTAPLESLAAYHFVMEELFGSGWRAQLEKELQNEASASEAPAPAPFAQHDDPQVMANAIAKNYCGLKKQMQLLVEIIGNPTHKRRSEMHAVVTSI